VLVSAALFSNSVAGNALTKALSEFSLVTSTACFDEFAEEILRPKFRKYLDMKDAIAIIEGYEKNAKLVSITHSITDCRDPKDNKFLELALSASAKFIVSGNADLLTLSPYHTISILTPAQFLA
jgi:uncharacterized protein